MEKYLRVYTSIGGFVRIEPTTGNLCWEREDLEPVKKQCAKKYLAVEGFIEQAIGALDPEPDSEVKAMLDSIVANLSCGKEPETIIDHGRVRRDGAVVIPHYLSRRPRLCEPIRFESNQATYLLALHLAEG